MKQVTAESYTLTKSNGDWLGQVVLTSDGMISMVTDWGNASYAWRSFGADFRQFIIGLNTAYFGMKLYSGNTYMVVNKKLEKACFVLAEEILPALQQALKEEIEKEKSTQSTYLQQN